MEYITNDFKDFLRFLKDNNCYREYFKSFNDVTNGKKFRVEKGLEKEFNSFFISTNSLDWILHGFDWKLTRNGFDFWQILDLKWFNL